MPKTSSLRAAVEQINIVEMVVCVLDCAVRCSTGRRLCAGLCCVLQHRPETVCWPVLVLQHTERLWRCQTQLCAVCTLADILLQAICDLVTSALTLAMCGLLSSLCAFDWLCLV